MKKIILMIMITFIVSSCGLEEKKVKDNVTDNKIKTSFSSPENELEKQINQAEINSLNNYDNKLYLVQLYLKYGNSYYNEKEYAEKALNILNKMNSDSKVDYFKGYAYEIQTQYQKAINQYEKVLSYKNLDIKEKTNALNQKGHVFDLMGDMEKANAEYLKAEKIDNEDLKTLLNRGRYESRKWNYEDSKKYFNKVLSNTDDNFIKSEMYYNLSTIYQKQFDGIDKAIEYAKLGIEANKDYPNNYLSLGVLYITKQGEFSDKAPEYLKKAISLYNNNSIAYKYLGIYFYEKDNFDKAIENFKKQVETSNNDILLMNNDKNNIKKSGYYDLARSYAYKGDLDNTLFYLEKILNGKKSLYYTIFLVEFNTEKGPFKNFIKNEQFESKIKDFLLLYNQK